jgi:ribosome maturation factor RimP
MPTPLDSQIAQLAEQALAAHGLKLVQARLGGDARNLTLRILAEQPSGASPSLEQCSAASRTLSAQLDVAELIQSRYLLEVSSPGLDRPLLTADDYRRFVGRHIKVQLATRLMVRDQLLPGLAGVITGFDGKTLELAADYPRERVSLALADIRAAHLHPTEAEMARVMKGEALPGQVSTESQQKENPHGS